MERRAVAMQNSKVSAMDGINGRDRRCPAPGRCARSPACPTASTASCGSTSAAFATARTSAPGARKRICHRSQRLSRPRATRRWLATNDPATPTLPAIQMFMLLSPDAQPHPMSIRNASSSGRFARARTRCSIEISLSYSVASSPFRYAGQTASNAASHALASG